MQQSKHSSQKLCSLFLLLLLLLLLLLGQWHRLLRLGLLLLLLLQTPLLITSPGIPAPVLLINTIQVRCLGCQVLDVATGLVWRSAVCLYVRLAGSRVVIWGGRGPLRQAHLQVRL